MPGRMGEILILPVYFCKLRDCKEARNVLRYARYGKYLPYP